MALRLANITFDCVDTIAQAEFWSAALGLMLKDGSSEWFAALDGGSGGPTWFFIKVPEGKTAKNRLHLDLESHDPRRDIARLIALGATHVSDKDEWNKQWAVLHDPEGNEFCVSGPHD
jgi:Glyoxalase-like domain